MRTDVRSLAKADSSFSASFTASFTKLLTTSSPHGPSAPRPNPPQNPFAPAKPTPFTSLEFYQTVLAGLHDAGIPFLVGGTFAMEKLAGIVRQTKDLDLFVRKQDLERIQDALLLRGVETHIAFAHWLAKATQGDSFVDL